jgi:DNA-binding beta-propeller fold protein YncE
MSISPILYTTTLAGLALVTGLLAATPVAEATPAASTVEPSAVLTASARALGPTFGAAQRGAAPTGDGPSAVAVDPATHTAYVGNGFNANGPNAGGNTVSVIDTRRCRARDVTACAGPWPTVTVGTEPSTLAVDPTTHTLYVTNSADNTVSVVDGRTCNGARTGGCDQTPATVPVGAFPLGVFADPRTGSVYVGSYDDDTVSVFSSATCNGARHDGCPTAPPPAFAVGDGPGDVDVNQRTHTAYVTTMTGLTAFDTRTCNAATQTGCQDTGTFTQCTQCFGPFASGVDPRTNTIYQGDGDTSIAAIDARSCNAENLDGCATADFGVVELPRVSFEHVQWVAVDSRRHTVYAAQHKNASVVVIDTRICNGAHTKRCSSLKPRSIHTGPNPQGLALDARTHSLYVADQVGDSLTVIDSSGCNAETAAGCRRRPPRVRVPGAGAIAVDSSRDTAYVAASGEAADHGAVAMINTRRCNAGKPTGCHSAPPAVAVEGSTQAIATDRAARTLYVASALDESTGTVSVLDLRACDSTPTTGCAVLATVPIHDGAPTSIAVNPRTHAVYVGASTPEDDSTVSVFNGSTCNATTTTGCDDGRGVMTFGPARGPSEACGGWYVDVAVNARNDTVYATNTEGCGGRGANVSVFDGSTCGATDRSGCGLPEAVTVAGHNPIDLVVDPRTNTVYTALLADGEFASNLAVIDGASCNAVDTSGCGRPPALAPTVFGSVGVALDPLGRRVYVTNEQDTSVSVVDARRCHAADTSGCARPATALPTDDYPYWVAVDTRRRTAYVTSPVPGTVSVVGLGKQSHGR